MTIIEYLKQYYHWPENKAEKFVKTASQDIIDSFQHDIILLNEA